MQGMNLYDSRGIRKYLSARERRDFAAMALRTAPASLTFCLTLLYTGARVSELLALTVDNVDRANSAIVFETLKRRRRGVFRAVPVPSELIDRIVQIADASEERTASPIWNWGRTTAWKRVKEVMVAAGIQTSLATPRAARHTFGVNAIQTGVALNILQRWMGHARIETTAIYANALGREERALARRAWAGLPDLTIRNS
jgi:integrase/recombinase XerD